ncbi:hypothetical protein Hanom_Chr00s000002g01599981 [Helianthus anomalus]
MPSGSSFSTGLRVGSFGVFSNGLLRVEVGDDWENRVLKNFGEGRKDETGRVGYGSDMMGRVALRVRKRRREKKDFLRLP